MFNIKKVFIAGSIVLLNLLSMPAQSVAAATWAGPVSQNAFVDLYKNVIDSVVQIVVIAENSNVKEVIETLPNDSPFGKLFEEEGEQVVPKMYGAGSGFVVTEDGIVYTNHHVISEKEADMRVTEIHIIWEDGKTRQAELVASDEVSDFAILQIIRDDDSPEEKFSYVTIGDSGEVLPGQFVAAIGSPLDQNFSITAGIVSAINRQSGKGRWVTYIQTDTVINKGNSGGPMFNLNGEVIGMNTLIVSPSGYFIGIGYAVPSNIFKKVAETLLEKGKVMRPWMGASLSKPSDELRDTLNISKEKPAVVIMSIAPNSPSDQSGLQQYDVIMSVGFTPKCDGVTLACTSQNVEMTLEEFIDFISESDVGDRIDLDIRRIIDKEAKTYEDLKVILILGNVPPKVE